MDPLSTALAEAGIDPRDVVVASPAADAPQPPEGPWVIVPTGQDFRLGGLSRGEFAEYAGSEDPRAIAGLLRSLLADRPSPQRIEAATEALIPYGERTAAGIAERTREGLEAARRRGRIGGRPHALSPAQKIEVKRMRDEELRPLPEIAALFKVSTKTIRRVM